MSDVVNVGTNANDGNGDTLRDAFTQINDRFNEILGQLSGGDDWAVGVTYTATPVRNWVINSGSAYIAATNHVSGSTFAADFASGKWLAADYAQLIADLAASSGSSLVGHLFSGTGAVPRPINKRLDDFVSVKDYGAVGDGVTDDTDSIEATVAAGYNIYFPSGGYKVTRSINCCGLIGRTFYGAGNYGGGTSVLLGTSAIGNYPILDFSGSNGIHLRDFAIQSFSSDSCYIGVLFARPGSISSGVHSTTNLSIYGKFAHSCLYQSSSEENTHFNLHAETLSAGARSISIVDAPESGVYSQYRDISNPSGGNTVTRFYSGRMINLTNDASNRCFFIKNSRHVTMHGAYFNPGPGIASCAIEFTNSSSINMHSLTGEGSCENVIKFNGANSNINISTCVLNGASNASIYGAAGSSISDMTFDSSIEATYLLDCDSLKASTINCQNHAVRVLTSEGNHYKNVYDSASISITSSSGDIIQIGTIGVTPNVGVVYNNAVCEVAMVSGVFNDVDRKLANMIVATATTSAITVSGFTKGYYGQEILFLHDSTKNLTLKYNSGSSPGNNIYTKTNADVTILAGTSSAERFVYAYSGWLHL